MEKHLGEAPKCLLCVLTFVIIIDHYRTAHKEGGRGAGGGSYVKSVRSFLDGWVSQMCSWPLDFTAIPFVNRGG